MEAEALLMQAAAIEKTMLPKTTTALLENFIRKIRLDQSFAPKDLMTR